MAIEDRSTANAMPEPKGAGTNRTDGVTATAVPCVGGFIFYVGQSRSEDRADFENHIGATVKVEDATGPERKRTA